MAYNKETGLYEGYIYKIINTVNDKIYIGQTTTTIEKRFRDHKGSVKNGKYDLYRDMRKYGIDCFDIIEIDNTNAETLNALIDKLNVLEINYIEKYDSFNNGYNNTIGGDNYDILSIKKPVTQYDYDGNIINKYISVSEASRQTNISSIDISMCCNKKLYTAGGYIWRFQNKTIKPLELELIKYKNRKVCQYDLNKNLINTFDTIVEASKYTSVGKASISKCCNHNNKTAGGYVFLYEGEEPYVVKPQNKPVNQFLNGVFIKTYDSAKVASVELKIPCANITNCCRGKKYKTVGGYEWKYA